MLAQEASTAVSPEVEKTSNPFPLPVISYSQGLINFSGDVGYNSFNEPLSARSAFQIDVQHHTSKAYSFSLFYLNGRFT